MSATDFQIPEDVVAVLTDPAAYGDQRIFDAYRWLRANQPLGVASRRGFNPFWVVTRHADVQTVSQQTQLFRSSDRPIALLSTKAEARIEAATGGPGLLRALVQMDPPDHPKFRALTQKWFTPGNLRSVEARIRDIAKTFANRLAEFDGHCDFVSEIALGFPLRVIMTILGVDPDDEPRMLRLTQEFFGTKDPDNARRGQQDGVAALSDVVAEFGEFFSAIVADRRATPSDDLASIIANAQVDGEPISDLDALSYFVTIATAGHDTTSSSSAGGMWALCEHQDQFDRLKANPAVMPGFVDEAIRWTTPVKHFMRSAAADTEIDGRSIKRGDWLMLCYASANRDEAVFQEPDAFRIDRSPNRHLAFGYGAHLCLGQYLAKLEMRILFEELLQRLNFVELDGAGAMTVSWFVNGPKRLPIRYRLH
ncbi:Cytochrome P450-terp (P450terp) (Cytochrome P450 108) [Bradyrhizobium sp. STM 3843]|uniref:cytochrome P450 n=1 Tax=Bradyrhizobium sp. STM 3843 TaxID=551947 RepID=UPI000240436F|nr:cytochrome P450 [Bradyrhizobium sp. STM 3843]CCE09800.1 Cytochrome P450-terp (P450terp) (Cytochrome P450 108) [Bradyrhizobium sp. STM 3843]